MNIEDQIEQASRKVSTDSITMGLGELANYYRDADLNINPEFQRAFRWSQDKKSNLIESLLLSIPLPSIFVFESKNGDWELVDGLQRLSTVFEFIGILRNPDTGKPLPPSFLVETKYIPALQNSVWKKSDAIVDLPTKDQMPISTALQRRIRTSRIQVEILRYPSDVETKYDLFQRLNRGGETANAQEVRNCLCVMANEAGFQEIKEYANSETFRKLVRLTDSAIEQQRNVEWAMRIMVHSRFDFSGREDVENFIDNGMKNLLSNKNWESALSDTKKAVQLLGKSLGDEALLPYIGAGGTGNRVSLRQIEAIAVGVTRNISKISTLGNPSEWVKKKVQEFWKQKEVDRMSAAGLSPTQRIPRTVPFGAEWFKP